MNEIANKHRLKMYFNFAPGEEEITGEALAVMEADFAAINKNFPNLISEEPMTHTIAIDDVIMREDEPVASPSIEELFRNAKNVNEREIEVPKVVA